MVNYEIISENVISTSEVLDIIKKQNKEEPSYREEKILEFLKKRKVLNLKDFKKVYKEILGLNLPRLEEENIIKIIEINPKNGTILRAILSNTGTIIVDENVKKILDILKKYQN